MIYVLNRYEEAYLDDKNSFKWKDEENVSMFLKFMVNWHGIWKNYKTKSKTYATRLFAKVNNQNKPGKFDNCCSAEMRRSTQTNSLKFSASLRARASVTNESDSFVKPCPPSS